MSIMDQLPALAGVIIGAVGSYTASSLTERSRWRRARAERWDQSRFQTYASYANALKAQLRIASRICAARGFDSAIEPLGPDEGLRQLADAEARRTVEWEAVLLVGEASTIAAGRVWHRSVWDLDPWVRGLRADHDGYASAIHRAAKARDDFYAHARKDLGISGSPPRTSWGVVRELPDEG